MIEVAITGSQCTGMSGYGCALRLDGRLAIADGVADPAAGLQRLCEDHGVEPRRTQQVRLDLGPGSYVGLRVAVTTAAFVARFCGAALLTVSSLELMAAAALAAGGWSGKGSLRPVLDARRQRYHTARLRLVQDSIEVLEPPTALPAQELLLRAQADDAVLAPASLHDLLASTGTPVIEPAPVSSATLFDERLRCQPAAPEGLEPLYSMASYAE